MFLTMKDQKDQITEFPITACQARLCLGRLRLKGHTMSTIDRMTVESNEAKKILSKEKP